MYFDAHIHLMNLENLKTAEEKGVSAFVLNATTPNEWADVLQISLKEKTIYPAIGIHPWFVDNLQNDWTNLMNNYLQKYPFLMIGEIGLDFLRQNKNMQLFVFKTMLEFAKKYHRPVHIHCIKAWNEMLLLLKEYPDLKILFHHFSASKEIVNQLLKFDTYFSISNSKNFKHIPQERLLVETDSPSLNKTPSDIIKLVESLNIDPKILWNNFQNFISPFDLYLKQGQSK